jgi:8-oxo-dGTP diphosphatase
MAKRARPKFTYDYPRPALTVDVAVVTLEPSPRVLLIQRKRDPFAGAWALPGGFVEESEPLETAARRELREETGIEVVELEPLYTAGDPGRDPRGWTVSVCYLARVGAGTVTAVPADDAAAAEWFALATLPELAFDHAKLLGRVATRLCDRGA